jgi:tetratricopeptide (TPR) repeat protein
MCSILLGLALALACLGAEEPLFEGLGSYTRPITTDSPEAQKYFNQGLNFYFGFNHGAAIRAFQAAETIDPDCAMAHWGVALACGPHINFPLVPAEENLWGNNPCQALLAVATPMLEGEILVREGKLDQGLAELRTAVNAEDAMHYDEPPGWLLPVRHSLGANLMQAGRFAEAEQVYRDDLARLPENGWSLFGLARSLEVQHKSDEAALVEARFQKLWSKADMQITSSCLCQPRL